MRGKLGIYSSMQLYDPDAAAYIAAVEFADGQALEAALKNAINDFVVSLKSNSLWNSIESAVILMGARTLNGALVPLKGAAPTAANFVSGDYDRKLGLQGNGSNKNINTNRSINDDGLNDNHFAFFMGDVTAQAATSRFYMSAGALTNGSSYIARRNSSTDFFNSRNRNANFDVFGLVASAIISFVGSARTSSTQYTVRRFGANQTFTRTSNSSNDGSNFKVFSRSDDIEYINTKIRYYSIGSFLTLSTYDTVVSALNSAIQAAIP